jgi:pseudouridine synthase
MITLLRSTMTLFYFLLTMGTGRALTSLLPQRSRTINRLVMIYSRGAFSHTALLCAASTSPSPPLTTSTEQQQQQQQRQQQQQKRQRLERIISNRGVGSRRDVQKLIKQGRVRVDGVLAKSSSAQYNINIEVKIDGDRIKPIPLLALYHKPVGVLSTMSDGNRGRDNLSQLQENYPFLKSMHPVGRLDMDTSGLLLFSSDGQLTNTLLHPSTEVEREYEAIVAHVVNADRIADVLRQGVMTTLGVFKANLLEVRVLEQKIFVPKEILLTKNDDDDSVDAVFGDSDRNNGISISSTEQENEDIEEEIRCSYVRLSVTEGKYRMVRRILHNAGHSVINLHRTRYGNINLDEVDLEEGDVCACSPSDHEWAVQLFQNKSNKKK